MTYLRSINRLSILFIVILTASAVSAQAPRETPPPPSEPRQLTIPQVEEVNLINGLKIVIVSKRDLPLVTVSLLLRGGAGLESAEYAGLADVTAEMLTKGTELRSATQIAEQMEFLGASLNADASWDSSSVSVTVMKDKLSKALAIMSDVVTRPKFPADELNLVKSQRIDGLKVRLNQPGALWSYVASRYSFGEHAVNGTPESIERIRTRDVESFHHNLYHPKNAVLIFAGDITKEEGIRYGRLFFGGWATPEGATVTASDAGSTGADKKGEEVVRRMLVIDLPDSGQAAVGYAKDVSAGRIDCGSEAKGCAVDEGYYPATVLNSVLGGGYSARLNQEIRIKRGLSYGARSGFDWRSSRSNFSATTQTKNESAAEVAELIGTEIEKLSKGGIDNSELVPRKAVVTGGFGRGLQTTNGLAARIRDLYVYGLDPGLLNSYIGNVGKVTDRQIGSYASNRLLGGDMIIVGDAKLFLDDLTKRFPNRTIEVVKAGDLNLNSGDLRKQAGR